MHNQKAMKKHGKQFRGCSGTQQKVSEYDQKMPQSKHCEEEAQNTNSHMTAGADPGFLERGVQMCKGKVGWGGGLC